MTERYWFEDTAVVEYQPIDADGNAIDSEDMTLDATTAVTIEDEPWTQFFDTDTFYRFKATVTKPIKQTYHFGDEEVVLKKPEDELRRSVWQLDNVHWTHGHPPKRRVTDTDQIRGFWRQPSYEDGQTAYLHVPSDDEESMAVIEDSAAVSVGFQASIDWVDGDGPLDGYQRGLIYDHVASVEQGRCPVEEGCGIHTDSASTNVMYDSVRTQATEELEYDVDSEHMNDGCGCKSECSRGSCSCGDHVDEDALIVSIDMAVRRSEDLLVKR